MGSWLLRHINYFIGAAFAVVLLVALWSSVAGVIQSPPAETAETVFHKHPKALELASNGPLGHFDLRQLQRGFQVYKEVCAACHSLSLVAFRNLGDLGYSDAEVKAIAKQWAIKQPTFDPKTGDRGTRDNVPADHFPVVYYPGTGSPPDLSLITKARHDGSAYVYSLLTGYQPQPPALIAQFPEAKTAEGMYYNPYFANLNISMPPPLTQDGQVEYLDGTRATKDQMAKDVAAFLTWTAEPTLVVRHRTGVAVLLFLLVTAFLAFGAYRSVWQGVKH